ncbi:ribonuclease toxin immunity protein CdiI [Klebsiella aerogenes]|nr:ribonuclease toxin immunity protein CdiI [Klebsiella aerogenes]
MNEYIFENIDYENDPEWVVRDYFNSMYLQGKLIWMLPYLINKIGCGVNETYCSFPDFEDPDPECHFEGIMFGVWDGELIVPEFVGFKYVRLACEKYIQLHPEDTEKVNELLAKIPA